MIADPMCPNIRVSLHAKEATVPTVPRSIAGNLDPSLVILKFLILRGYCETQ